MEQREPRNLPGEGREPTPAIDTTTREVPPPRSDLLPDAIIDIQTQLGQREAPDDAGSADAADASAPDAGGPT